MSVTQKTFQEQQFLVLRKHGSILIIPTVILGLVAGGLLFVEPKLKESWQHQLLWGLSGLVIFFFWLLPSIRFFTNRTEITSNRVVVHRGLFGGKTDQAAWGELTGVSVSRGLKAFIFAAGDIHLHREFGVDLIIPKAAKAKKLAREIEGLMARRLGMGQ